jgi:hypothetical protein
MTHLKPSCGPGVGLFFANEDTVVWNRTGAATAVGDLVMFDIADTQAETDTTLTEGSDSSTFGNVIQPTTAGIGAVGGHGGYFFGIALEAVADNAKCKVRIRGIVPANLSSAAVTIGSMLVGANAASTLVAASTTAGVKRLAIAREANGSAAGTFSVLFDGINGFGATFAS